LGFGVEQDSQVQHVAEQTASPSSLNEHHQQVIPDT